LYVDLGCVDLGISQATVVVNLKFFLVLGLIALQSHADLVAQLSIASSTSNAQFSRKITNLSCELICAQIVKIAYEWMFYSLL